MRIKKAAGKRGSGKTALIADDNPVIRKMLVEAFLSDGFKACGEAKDGRKAVQVAKRINPDVIVLDLSMPIMNGIQAASRLREMLPNTPIILFSFHADSLSKADASKAGISLVLPKTATISELIDRAHRLMAVNRRRPPIRPQK